MGREGNNLYYIMEQFLIIKPVAPVQYDVEINRQT
jgi:hypothetical protein